MLKNSVRNDKFKLNETKYKYYQVRWIVKLLEFLQQFLQICISKTENLVGVINPFNLLIIIYYDKL